MSAQEQLPPPTSFQLRRGPWVPARPLLRLVRRQLAGEPVITRLTDAGLRGSWTRDVDNGRTKYVSFDVADRIIVDVLGDAGLWRREPFLRRIIER